MALLWDWTAGDVALLKSGPNKRHALPHRCARAEVNVFLLRRGRIIEEKANRLLFQLSSCYIPAASAFGMQALGGAKIDACTLYPGAPGEKCLEPVSPGLFRRKGPVAALASRRDVGDKIAV
jgi:hypothetical protein